MRFNKAYIPALILLTTGSIGLGQEIDHWETLIFDTDTCRYFQGESDPGADWQDPAFDDSEWNLGKGSIGYGDGDDSTIIEPVLSVFSRFRFIMSDTARVEEAVIHMDYDDAFVAYLNGEEIARRNIGTEGIVPGFNETPEEDHEAVLYEGDVPESFSINWTTLENYLIEGENILAIQVHNVELSSSDLTSRVFFSIGVEDSNWVYALPPSWFKPPVHFYSSNLPLVLINTFGQQIRDEPKITAHMGIIDNGPGITNFFTDSLNHYDGWIGIEFRGNTGQGYPKKPYGFETRDSLGENNNVELLGLPEENDWVLYNPYADKALIRNALIFKLARDMGRYAPRTRFCELQLNGDYQGVYVLMEKIKRDSNRLNISKLRPEDISGDQLTGGYILKVDWGWGGPGWNSVYSVPGEEGDGVASILYVDPDYDELMDVQRGYIKEYVTEFENALKGSGFNDPVDGYQKYMDVGSFIDFFICQELANNVDAYALSSFFYKDRDKYEGKLTMGPLWDFNFSLGNADYGGSQYTNTFSYETYLDPGPAWWSRFLEDKYYADMLDIRWKDLREGVLNTQRVLGIVDSMAMLLDDAQERNNQKWQVYGNYVWPNYFVGDSFEEEVVYLKDWLTERMEWLDDNMPVNGPFISSITESSGNEMLHLYPNPNDGIFTISRSLSAADRIRVDIINSIGQLVEHSVFETGSITLELNISEHAPGLYFVRLFAENQVYTIKVIRK